MKINGGCHCGAIAYEADLDPEKVGICHCTDCQALSASAFRTLAIVSGDKFAITKGVPTKYIKTGDSGNRRVQAFCSNCGSALYASDVGENPKQYNIRAGTIVQRYDLTPKFEVWLHSALPWVSENPLTKKFDKNP
ncbi:MAG: GFA family protein [Rhizobiaceae bacterium]|nr:GFA family protein [Rhizobiaceae bacterium]